MPCAETKRAQRCAVAPDAAPRKGKRAYVLSLAGQSPQSWQDHLRGTLVTVRSLRATKTEADIVVMVPTKGAARVPKCLRFGESKRQILTQPLARKLTDAEHKRPF